MKELKIKPTFLEGTTKTIKTKDGKEFDVNIYTMLADFGEGEMLFTVDCGIEQVEKLDFNPTKLDGTQEITVYQGDKGRIKFTAGGAFEKNNIVKRAGMSKVVSAELIDVSLVVKLEDGTIAVRSVGSKVGEHWYKDFSKLSRLYYSLGILDPLDMVGLDYLYTWNVFNASGIDYDWCELTKAE